MAGFIGVHVGAGNFSTKSEHAFLKVCRKASIEGTLVLKNGGTALSAVTAATCVLEDSPFTNAGLGSNLTWDGCVECDAMVMDGHTLHYGAVGAVAGVKNPVMLAQYLCQQQSLSDFPHGRLKPSIVVSEGARRLAEVAGVTTVPPKELIVGRSLKLYKHYKRKVEKLENGKLEAAATIVVAPLDTVGAVCADGQGNMAATCSSGGIVLKAAGRLGQATTFGGGCWADNGLGTTAGVASSTSGCGEYLIRTALGKEAAQGVQASDFPTVELHRIMKHKFLESPFLRDMPDKLAGVILIRRDNAGEGEFLWTHSTRDMCVGYMSCGDARPTSRMSRLADGMKPGVAVVVEGINFRGNSK